MSEHLKDRIKNFVLLHQAETLALLRTLVVIPAPSHKEQRRGEFCLKWLQEQGAKDAYLDRAGNVVWAYNCDGGPVVVISAHQDTVFDDDNIILKEDDVRMAAPGVGDDTANLVNLLMCARYVLENEPVMKYGIYFVIDTGEEGLGNLYGIRQFFSEHSSEIKEMISFDLYLNLLIVKAVGSSRMRISVKTKGGHSFKDFGNTNANQVLASLIQKIYAQRVPSKGVSTYNVGVISGGTSVNTIAEQSSMLYEIRSDEAKSLKVMQEGIHDILEGEKREDVSIKMEMLATRPCGKIDVDDAGQRDLIERNKNLIAAYTGRKVLVYPGSTDANIPLSEGIPAVTIGTVDGGGAHTYEEWIAKDSMITGQETALAVVLQYKS